MITLALGAVQMSATENHVSSTVKTAVNSVIPPCTARPGLGLKPNVMKQI